VNVISKSGGTAETMAQYLVVRRWLEEAMGPAAARHLVFTTDPRKGALREIATRDGIAALDVPPEVGGRFSVLSPVGLLPAALVGIDIEALLAGARRAIARSESDDLLQNPAALYAGLTGPPTRCSAPHQCHDAYTDRLREFAEWYRQLWAERLGKANDRRGQRVHSGPTPVGAIGATDQHSQVQLFMEGPFDKVVTFLALDHFPEEVSIPGGGQLPAELTYLGGQSLNRLLTAEYQATSAALARMGRMSCSIHLEALSAESLGNCSYSSSWPPATRCLV
jgi:glucose-6-phosphate isomerase